jgi:ferric-dicitrate binding protein FerR (iron transport regulator)
MAKRPSVEKAAKVLIAAMRETAEEGDRKKFERVLDAWELNAAAIDRALQAWDEKRREIQRGGSGSRGSSQ